MSWNLTAQTKLTWLLVIAVRGRFRGPETPPFCFLTIAGCPSHTAVHRWWSGLPCCCCPYLEQSDPTRHVCTLCVCFPRSPQGFPLSHDFCRNFCSVCAVTVVIFGHLNRSFYFHATKCCHLVSVGTYVTACVSSWSVVHSNLLFIFFIIFDPTLTTVQLVCCWCFCIAEWSGEIKNYWRRHCVSAST